MKKSILFTLAALFALPIALVAQISQYSYTVDAGTTFFVNQPAKATAVSGAIRLPLQSPVGYLMVTESGITGSPSGCQFAESLQSNVGTTATSAVGTVTFTPANGVQTLFLLPTIQSADSAVLTYTCSTYPTAGLLSVTLAPIDTFAIANTPGIGDPCLNPNVTKASAVISIASAGTNQVIPLSTGKAIYVCGVTDGSAGTTPSIVLEYGTGSNCATSPVALTGAIPFTSGSAFTAGWGGAVTQTPVSQELCVITVGTGHYGVISYVQQ